MIRSTQLKSHVDAGGGRVGLLAPGGLPERVAPREVNESGLADRVEGFRKEETDKFIKHA